VSSVSQIGALMKLRFEHYDCCLDLCKDTELRGSFIVERDGRKSRTWKQVGSLDVFPVTVSAFVG
jgi:hypothetical protein